MTNGLPDGLALPDIVTIGGKLCAARAMTTAEAIELARRWRLVPLYEFGTLLLPPGFYTRLRTREGLAEALVVMYGVEPADALAHVDEETRQLEAALLAEQRQQLDLLKRISGGHT